MAMTDEEFERLKAAEKEHLREKQRLRKKLESLKRRGRTEGIVQRMKQGAERLLRETESLVETLRSQGAHDEARLEVAHDESAADRQDAEEALREERAEALLRQYKAAQPGSRDQPETDASSETEQDGPEKTIGRMRTPRTGDRDTDGE
jgi:hypothetical protein